ncbi:hypothetical protein ASPACDRAFT_1859003 [Aspergillus aculeatus ATCC 16872]|uniref:chitinase n=1 Tax=Aspergillus aculeatus (strain ATCC 16872 / CBS 172.66 / WB 5094) TaxID=690307 RepID=A0A1L9WL75_ASPA1|nr:uncharacterized protein ASPACDRAFT_1859003 [Aspergillus aculeatus ATCC 16872]OJJ96909.1 hypothetical protein ASPACDRAFT_1859003 [Aspergillus aculeatus ATCC 16872]
MSFFSSLVVFSSLLAEMLGSATCNYIEAQFESYNALTTALCNSNTLQPGQYACCSPGSLPDFSPKPYANGTCYTYNISSGDDCPDIAKANQMNVTKIATYNKETWGWAGYQRPQIGQHICRSEGTPASQLPWTMLCADPRAPGTAKNGTNGCISNCGTNITNNEDKPSQVRRIGYFEAWNSDRPCLHMDFSKFQGSDYYTHVHWAFANVTTNWAVDVSGYQDQFDGLLNLTGISRILSFGGWGFSTTSYTYSVFRTGVQAANRQTFAQNVVDFIVDNDLDGVDCDWEYPGAQDIPGVPADYVESPQNYLEFLKIVRDLLPTSKSLSIAAPASYWYLRAFPIKQMAELVDYIVYMTYDLHGHEAGPLHPVKRVHVQSKCDHPVGDSADFDCTLGDGTDIPCIKLNTSYTYEETIAEKTTALTLTDSDGYEAALANFGLEADWVTLGDYEKDLDFVAPHASKKFEYKFTGFPNQNDSMVVPNPKDIVTKGLGSIPNLKTSMQATLLDIMMGVWTNGTSSDAALAYSTPVFLLMQAVDEMAQAKALGQQEEKEEEEEAKRKKNFILLIVSVVLMFVPIVGEEVAAAAGMASLARAIAIAGEIGNAALGIYDTVDDPSSAVVNIIGMLLDVRAIAKVSRDGQGIASVAKLRRAMTSDEVAAMGSIFKANDDNLQAIMKVCKF